MFENLSDRLERIYKNLKGRGILKEADVDPIRIFGSDPDYGVKAYKAYKELYQNPPPDIAFSPTMKEVIQASEEHRSEVPELARQGLGMQNN